MADGIEVKLEGLREVQAWLDGVKSDLRTKYVRRALIKAADVFVRRARAIAPVLQNAGKHPRRQAGTLRRNIRAFRSKKYAGAGGVLGVYVTVKASKKDLKNAPITGDPYYFRWVEGGHKIVPRSRKIGVARGKNQYAQTITSRRRQATAYVQPRPFLGTSFEQQGSAAAQAFEDSLVADLAKIAKG